MMKKNYILSGKEMAECDKNTIEHFGIPSLVLMERAALAVSECVRRSFTLDKKVFVLAGCGNNGADGIAVARLLMKQGYTVSVMLCGDLQKGSSEFKTQLSIYKKYQGNITEQIDDSADIIVDALFGIGLSREVSGKYKTVIDQINNLNAYVISVDIPSGLSSVTGTAMGNCIIADETVTFGFLKIGHVLYPGREYVGKITVSDIGIDETSFLDFHPKYFSIKELSDITFPARKRNAHKGSYGKLLIVAGSKNIAGAAILAVKAAFCMGAGMVKLITHKEQRVVLQEAVPELMIDCYDDQTSYAEFDALIKANLSWCDGILAGPGMGESELSKQLLSCLLPQIPQDKSVVLDADAINFLSHNKEYVDILSKREQPAVYTPHAAEFSRLSGFSISQVKAAPLEHIESVSRKWNCVTVYKDACSIVSDRGNESLLNLTGNDGMAVAGSGDVLAGITAVLCMQMDSVFDASCISVSFHGMLGDRARLEWGSRSMLPTHMIEKIPELMKGLE